MAHCDEYLELISAALDGALSPAEAEKLEAHLAQCPACRTLSDELTALHAALPDLPFVDVPADLTERIMNAVAAEQVLPFAPPEKKRSSVRRQRWLASAAVLALVLLGTWSWRPWARKDISAASGAPDQQEIAGDVSTTLQAASTTQLPTPEAASEIASEPTALFDETIPPVAAGAGAATGEITYSSKIGGVTQKNTLSPSDDSLCEKSMDEAAEGDATTPRMGRMAPELEYGSLADEGDIPAAYSLFPTEVPEEAASDLQSFMVTALPTGAATQETALTAQEALELLAEYLWPGIAVEESDFDGEGLSRAVTDPDGSFVTLAVDGMDENGNYRVFLHSSERDTVSLYLVDSADGTVFPLFAPESELP